MKRTDSSLFYIIITTCLMISVLALAYFGLGTIMDRLTKTQYPNWPTGSWGIVICLLCLIIYHFLHPGYFKGYTNIQGAGSAFLFCLPLLVYGILSNLKHFSDPNLSQQVVLAACGAGLCEETLWRAIAIPYMMHFEPLSAKRIPLAVWLTALGFSLFHLSNLMVGADIIYTLLQLCYALGAGIVFGAVYLRTGDIIMPMLTHFLMDLFNMMGQQKGRIGIQTTMDPSLNPVMDGLFSIMMVLYGLWLIRRSKREEIIEIWKDKSHPY